MAEGVGFEPTSRCRETVFKTAAFDHSAIPPEVNNFCIIPTEKHGWQSWSATRPKQRTPGRGLCGC